MIEEITLQYFAGFFDGEGYVSIVKTYLPNKRIRHQLRVGVSNTDIRVPVEFKKKFGGEIYFTKTQSKKHSQGHEWLIFRRHAKSFLEQILPYLIIKKTDAEIGLAFLSLFIRKRGKGITSALTETELKERESLRLRLIDKHGLASRAAS